MGIIMPLLTEPALLNDQQFHLTKLDPPMLCLVASALQCPPYCGRLS